LRAAALPSAFEKQPTIADSPETDVNTIPCSKRRMSRDHAVAVALIAACMASFGVATSALAAAPAPADSAGNGDAVALVGVPDFSRITQRFGSAVVNISVSGMRKVVVGPDEGGSADAGDDAQGDDPARLALRRFQQRFGGSGASMSVPVRGLGSGFIIGEDGLILTNAHVVANASEVIVKLTDRREFKARVLGSDPKTDIAVLKVDARQLPVVSVGDPADLRVGEWVLAIGSPYGFENSVTVGVVSATGRSLPDDSAVPFIQTDAAVNPGNSGGPLFNARGQVVGINSQIFSRTGGFQGLSFAIPIDLAMRVQQQIVTTGHASHGALGVDVQEVDQALADAFRLPRPAGALVADVQPGGAAAEGGLRPGDVILRVNDKPIESSGDLPAAVTMAVPGQRLAIDAWRDGQPVRLVAILSDADKPIPQRDATARGASAAGPLGLHVRPLRPGEQRAIGATAGLLVEAVSGASQVAGMQAGDVLLAINGRPVASVDEARSEVARAQSSVALLVQRGSDKVFVAIRLS
jgi:serine protease Do